MRILLLFILFFSGISEPQAKVTITADQKEYAGQKLEFYFHDDPVTLKKTDAFSLNFDRLGNAAVTVDVTELKCFYCDFGIYRGMLYLEPGADINLMLPPIKEKSFADQKNPYFEPVTFWFNTAQNNNLNNRISAFTIQLNQYTDKHFEKLYFQGSKVVYDSLIYQLDKEFSDEKSEVFKNYKALNLKLIQADAFRLKPENYSAEFAAISKANWQSPAFEDLFEKTFNNQLSFVSKAVKNSALKEAVNSSDMKYLENWVETNLNIKGEMAQLVLLKLLYNGYYSGDFSKSSIESMVRSSFFKNSGNKLIVRTADNIYTKITFLKIGTKAPSICLNNLTGNNICTTKNNGKYKYLIFADLEMIVCREHLKYLAAIDEKFQKYLEIYVVFRNIDAGEIEKFKSKIPVPGTLLIDTTGQIIQEYGIRSYPQCYLLDENHNVGFESAKSPLDGFEQQFTTFLKNELIEQQRNQSR